MKIYIEKESSVEEVKKVFTNCYPYLKLELYKKPPDKHYALTDKEIMLLNKFARSPDKIVIDIDNDIIVAELEDQFLAIDLIAEVFRKSGNVWVEASLTSNWTLQQQNAEGEEISRHFNVKKSGS